MRAMRDFIQVLRPALSGCQGHPARNNREQAVSRNVRHGRILTEKGGEVNPSEWKNCPAARRNCSDARVRQRPVAPGRVRSIPEKGALQGGTAKIPDSGHGGGLPEKSPRHSSFVFRVMKLLREKPSSLKKASRSPESQRTAV